MDKNARLFYNEGMNPVYDFSAGDHSTMVGDAIRLDAYYAAIQNQTKPGTIVAEIGTGTGILAAYAASFTQAPVAAIEYYDSTADLAEAMFIAAKMTHVKVYRGESYGITLNPSPDLLVTETIGALGPEEHIVELCHDFKKRHPSIKTIIPSRLRVMAEPILSTRVKELERMFHDYFTTASFGSFNYEAIKPVLTRSYASEIKYNSLSGAKSAGPQTVLADYLLGSTETSAFSSVVDLTEIKECDAVQLFFEATLDQHLVLSTHHSKPETHWGHAYVVKAEGCQKLRVTYSGDFKSIQVRWEI